MIDLYSTGAPNGRKITIFLEETGLPYRLHIVDLYKQEQRLPEFLAVTPNGRIPAIVDPEGPDGQPLTLWESGAILQYLAEKTGRFIPVDGAARWSVLKWLYFQVTHAPYWGQAHVFRLFTPEPIPYAIERYTRESHRLYKVIDDQLRDNDFIAGPSYSIADMALFPWVEYHDWQGVDLSGFPAVARWFDTMLARPAVEAGRRNPWAIGEYGPSEEGANVRKVVESRFDDPAMGGWTLPADGETPRNVTGWMARQKGAGKE